MIMRIIFLPLFITLVKGGCVQKDKTSTVVCKEKTWADGVWDTCSSDDTCKTICESMTGCMWSKKNSKLVPRVPEGKLTPEPDSRANNVKPGKTFVHCIKVGVIVDQSIIKFFGGSNQAEDYFATLLRMISPAYELEWNAKLRLKEFWIYNSWKKNSGDGRLTELQKMFTKGSYQDRRPEVNLVMHATHKELDGGGIAWLEGLFSYEYQFSVVMGIEGGFSDWDKMVIAHELGHGFGGDHTHELRVNGKTIDKCHQKCNADIPRKCDPTSPNPLPDRGGFCGSIMSYCDTCGPGNVVFDFHDQNVANVQKLFNKHSVNYALEDWDAEGHCDDQSLEPRYGLGGPDGGWNPPTDDPNAPPTDPPTAPPSDGGGNTFGGDTGGKVCAKANGDADKNCDASEAQANGRTCRLTNDVSGNQCSWGKSSGGNNNNSTGPQVCSEITKKNKCKKAGNCAWSKARTHDASRPWKGACVEADDNGNVADKPCLPDCGKYNSLTECKRTAKNDIGKKVCLWKSDKNKCEIHNKNFYGGKCR